MIRLIHLDECGYTGQNLLTETQPLLVVSSVSLPGELAEQLKSSCFSKVKPTELKYTRLRKSPAGRTAVVHFIKELATEASKAGEPIATIFTVHKKFHLLTLLIDWWVECAMYADGIDLYEKKGNLALANVCYTTLESLRPKQFEEVLRRFERMMRERTQATYARFWSFVYKMFEEEKEETVKNVLIYFLGAEKRLGFRHLEGLPKHVLDVTTSCALETVARYREKTADPIIVLHDEASYMSHDQYLWDVLTKPEAEPRTVRVKFPLDVRETRPVNSVEYTQVQFADVLAGANAGFVRSRQNKEREIPYFKALEAAGILSLSTGAIWPSSDVTPEELGSEDFSNKEIFREIGELVKSRN